MNLLQMYFLFAKIGLFTFGGGYAMIPLFQVELVNNWHFMTNAEFANFVALAQVTPELLRGMQFDAGSMGPKVAACREFVEACGGIAGIGALNDGAEILAGEKGTLIRN